MKKALKYLYRMRDINNKMGHLPESLYEAIKELENSQDKDCKDCKYGEYGVDSIGVEVECNIGWNCSRGKRDMWIPKGN